MPPCCAASLKSFRVSRCAALVRRAPPPLRNARGVTAAARQLDRAAAVLDKRPAGRLALLLYVLLLHLYLLL